MLIHITLVFNLSMTYVLMCMNGSGMDWTANLSGSKILQTFSYIQPRTPVTLKWMVGNRRWC